MHELVQLIGSMPSKLFKIKVSNSITLQRSLFARSERVKGIDFHPTEPWVLTTLYSGMLFASCANASIIDLFFCNGCF